MASHIISWQHVGPTALGVSDASYIVAVRRVNNHLRYMSVTLVTCLRKDTKSGLD